MSTHLPAFCKLNDKNFEMCCLTYQWISIKFENVIYTSSEQVLPQITCNNVMGRSPIIYLCVINEHGCNIRVVADSIILYAIPVSTLRKPSIKGYMSIMKYDVPLHLNAQSLPAMYV